MFTVVKWEVVVVVEVGEQVYALWVSVVAPEVQLWKWCQTSMYATESRFLTWGLGRGDLVGDLDRRGEWDLALSDLPSSDLKETNGWSTLAQRTRWWMYVTNIRNWWSSRTRWQLSWR